MKWIKNILGLFRSKKDKVLTDEELVTLLKQEVAQQEQEEGNSLIAQVVFQLSKAGDVNIFCHWKEDTEEVANDLSQLLAGLCTDRGIDIVSTILMNHIQDHPESQPFVLAVIRNIYSAKNNNSPVIDPTSVFHRNN